MCLKNRASSWSLSKVFTVVNLYIITLWVMWKCSLVGGSQRFLETYLRNQLVLPEI
jgi:hypothetical protein